MTASSPGQSLWKSNCKLQNKEPRKRKSQLSLASGVPDVCRNRSLFDVQNIDKTGDFKNLHDGIVDMGDCHHALFAHCLLRGKQYSKTGGGNVLKFLKVHHQFGYAFQRLLQLCFQLGGCIGVQPTFQYDDSFPALNGLVNVQHACSPSVTDINKCFPVISFLLYRSCFKLSIKKLMNPQGFFKI